MKEMSGLEWLFLVQAFWVELYFIGAKMTRNDIKVSQFLVKTEAMFRLNWYSEDITNNSSRKVTSQTIF